MDNPPAFPVKVKRNTSSDPLATPREFRLEGMSLRDWFAGQALAGLCSTDRESTNSALDDFQAVAADAYEYADTMLAEREKRNA